MNRKSGHGRAGLRRRVRADTARRSTRRKLLIALGAGVFATPLASFAQQQPKTVPRIAYLSAGSASSQSARVEAFRQGLHGLGYVEGRNIAVEYRFADGKPERLPALLAELARLKVEIIVSGGPSVTSAAKNAPVTIPIVMGFDNDPVGAGFVASLARPGRNITGLSTFSPEISGKQLELLREIVPKLSRVAVLGNSTEPGYAQVLREMGRVAGALGVLLQSVEVRGSNEIDTAFREINKGRADAILVLATGFFLSERTQLADFVVKSRLPAIYYAAEFVEDGGLISYGVSYPDLFRRAATYVDKILKGAKPADLPVEQPTRFELVINLKTAKALGIKIPQPVLMRSDRMIEQ